MINNITVEGSTLLGLDDDGITLLQTRSASGQFPEGEFNGKGIVFPSPELAQGAYELLRQYLAG